MSCQILHSTRSHARCGLLSQRRLCWLRAAVLAAVWPSPESRRCHRVATFNNLVFRLCLAAGILHPRGRPAKPPLQQRRRLVGPFEHADGSEDGAQAMAAHRACVLRQRWRQAGAQPVTALLELRLIGVALPNPCISWIMARVPAGPVRMENQSITNLAPVRWQQPPCGRHGARRKPLT